MTRRAAAAVAVAVAAALPGAGCSRAAEPPVSMPVGAFTLVVAPDSIGTIWALTDRGPYRSPDGGHSWRHQRGIPGARAISFNVNTALIFARRAVRVLPFGGGYRIERVGIPVSLTSATTPYYRSNRVYGLDAQGRLWLSADGGLHWIRQVAAGLPASAVCVSAVRGDLRRSDRVYVAAGDAGLWVSKRYGARFSRVAGVPAVTQVAITAANNKRVLAAGPSGIWLSTDHAQSFHRVFSGPVTALTLDPRNWRLAYATSGHGRLLRSIDGGATWDTSG